MEDKSTFVRNHILGMLESGELKGRDKLPGARDLLSGSGISLPTVQNAIEILVREGVLETIPRKGTFVQEQWKSRILQQNLTLFRPGQTWFPELRELMHREIPEIWVSEQFRGGAFEIQTTHYVQAHHDRYLDLSELFNSCFPDQSDFFRMPVDAFRIGSRLVGVPIIFSPRVIFYNPKLFQQAGCRRPEPGWTYEDFLDCIRKLRRILPPPDVFRWHNQTQDWINFVRRAGGCLIDPNDSDCVKIDSAETRRGLKLFRDLRKELGISQYSYPDDFVPNFLSGKAAMLLEPREFRSIITKAGFEDWDTVPLPRISGGPDVNVQASDALCVRRDCVDLALAERLLKLLLSPEFQNCLARWNYGIPIRKSVVGKTIDCTDSRDVLFLSETPKMCSHYHLDSPEIYNLVWQGIACLLVGEEDIESGTAELAEMVRTCLKIRKQAVLFARKQKSTEFIYAGEVS